jgi:hypothetical protein
MREPDSGSPSVTELADFLLAALGREMRVEVA